MKMSISNISKTLKGLTTAFNSRAENNLKKQTESFVEDLRAVTPVDTGKAQASWVIEKVANGYDVKNTVEYIQYLNQGSSKQAPAHFVESTALKYGTPVGSIVESS